MTTSYPKGKDQKAFLIVVTGCALPMFLTGHL